MTKFALFVFLLLTVVVVLAVHLAGGIFWLVGKLAKCKLSYSSVGWTALGLAAMMWLLIAYGFFIGRFRFSVNEVSYSHPGIPASFDGYKVVHISDSHLSTFEGNMECLHRIVDSINAQRPDLICFTGDFVSLKLEEAFPFAEELRRLSAKDGVVSVLGNHDFYLYSNTVNDEDLRVAEVARLVDFQRSLGWRVLRNENMFIRRGEDRIAVLGVDNQSCTNQGFRTIASGNLVKAMEGSEGCFRFLLSHDPTHWTGEVLPLTDIPLQLSGHTHSAQIRLFGWTPASWKFDETAGFYTRRDGSGLRSLYINVGFGSTLPIRIGCDGEITVMTFRRAD